MMYLQASWGFVLMIGGLLAVWVVLMILDGPAQRRDALRREDDQERKNRPVPATEPGSLGGRLPQSTSPGTAAK